MVAEMQYRLAEMSKQERHDEQTALRDERSNIRLSKIAIFGKKKRSS